MSKSKFMSALLVVLSLLILIGIALMIYFMSGDEWKENLCIFVEENGREITFKDLRLIPGTCAEYTLSLYSGLADTYEVTLSLSGDTEAVLNQCVYVYLEANGRLLCEELIMDMLGEEFTFSCMLNPTESCPVRVVYRMPTDVGDEVQGASSDLILTVKASNGEALYEN